MKTRIGSFIVLVSLLVLAGFTLANAQTTIYQSENGTWSSGSYVATDHTGYTGTGYVNTANVYGSWAQVSVTAPSAGSYKIQYRYANGTTTNRPCDIYVNGTKVISNVAFPGTGAWTTWGLTSEQTVTLSAGLNTIRARATTSNGTANLDNVSVTSSIVTYSLTVNAANGTVTKNPDQASYNSGTVVQLTATPALGYHFTGWSGDLTGSTNPTNVTMDANKNVTATFAQNEYTLTINKVGNGTVTPDIAAPYHYGDVVTLSATADAGWTFAGISPSAVVTMDDNKTVTATFTQNEYTLTINKVGNGTVTPDIAAPYHYGDVVTLSATADAGWTFAGISPSAVVTMDDNKTVTATFTQNEYTLTINKVGNGTVTPDIAAPYHYGDVVTLSATADAGWTFAGISPSAVVTMDDNKTVTATFTQNEYTLTINKVGNGTVTPDIAAPYHYGDVVTLSATADAGWTFAGISPSAVVTMDDNKTVTATFTQNEYTLTINKVGNGTVTPDIAAPYHYGDVVTLSATADAGWTFAGISPSAVVTMDDNKTVTATFTQNEYTLTINKVGNGTVTPDIAAPYHYGDVVTLSATADAGWTFAGISPSAVVTMDDNKTVTATFTQNEYTLTINKVGNGTVTPDIAAPYHYGDVVTLSATADAGWTFAGISPSAVVTMDDNKTVTATFTQNEYTLTINKVGNGTVTPDIAAPYHYGDVVTLSATADAGWTFAGISPSAVVTMDDNKTVTATFTITPMTITSKGTGGGDWNTASTWTGGMIPRSVDNVIVQGGDAVTLIAAGSCSSLTLNAGATLSLNAASLTIPGATWNFATTSTVVYNTTTTIQSAPVYGNLTYAAASGGPNGNLTINGNLNITTATLRGISATSGTVTHTVAGNVIIGPGTAARISAVNSSSATTASCTWNIGGSISLTGINSGNRMIVFESAGPHTGTAVYNINGDLTIGALSQLQVRSSTTANASPCTGTVNVKGNIFVTGTISTSTGATGTNFVLNLNGTGAQRYAGAFPNAFPAGQTCTMQVNNASGVTLDSVTTLRANVTLQLNNGLVKTSPTSLLTVNGGVINGASSSSFISGPLARIIATGAQSPTFPIGDATTYTPINLAIGNVTTSGMVTAATTPGLHAQISTSGLESSKTLNRYFTLTSNTGIVFDSYAATLNFNAADVIGGANTANYIVKKHDIAGWSTPITANPLATSIQTTGNTSFSDFVVGEPAVVIPKYTLTMNAANGTVTKSPDQVSYDSAAIVQLTASPATGYTFTGWSGDVTGSTNPATVTMDANKNITANFAIKTYTLTVNAANGTVAKNPDQVSYDSAAIVQLTATPAAGYTFTGWSGDITGSSNPVNVTMAANVSITANFAINTYTLTVSSTNGTVAKSPDQAAYDSASVVQLTATPALGYRFTGWSGDVTGSTNPVNVTIDANKNITANFVLTYTLAVSAVHGTVAKSPDQAAYDSASVVQLTASPATGYHFTGWSGDISGTENPVNVTMDANKNITANFAINTYTLTVTAVNGTVAKNPDQAVYDSESVVQLTALPAAGYHFTGWSGDLTGSTNPVNVTLYGNTNVTANFELTVATTFTLTVSATNGTVAKNPDLASYDSASVVQLTATSALGYTFTGWSGSITSTDNPVNVTMDANKDITANFTASPLTITSNGTSGGDWNTASTWTGGMIPRSIDNVIVQGSDVVTLIAAGSCSNLTLNAGTTLSLNAASLTIPGTSWNFDVTSTVIYNSTTTIQTAMAYGNLVYASTSSGGVSTTTPTNLTINGNLTVTAGTLRGISATSGTVTHTVAGNVIVGPGVAARISAVNSSNATTANCTWNIGGNVSLTGNNSGNRMIVFESAGPHTGTAVYNINGNLTIGGLSQLQVRSSTTANTSTCTGTVNVKGNLTTSGTIGSSTGATGTNFVLNFNGASAQRYAGAFPNAFPAGQTCTIQLNNDWGVTLDSMATLRANVTVQLNSGLVKTSPTTLLTVNGGAISGANSMSFISGPLARVVATGAQSPIYPIGDATKYAPVNVAIGSVTTSGTLTAVTKTGIHPQIGTSGLASSKTLNRYYTLTNNGMSIDSYTATLNFDTADVMGGANTANYIVKKYDGSAWSTPTTANPLATSIQTTGNISFSDFVVGEVLPPIPTFTLTVNATNGSVVKNPDFLVYDSLTVVQLTASPAIGYRFIGWSGDVSGSTNPIDVTMDANKNITANFDLLPTFTLTVSATNGTVAKNPDLASYDSASVVQLTATSALGYTFTGWSGSITSTDNPVNVTMDANKDITANFTASPLTITSNGTSGGDWNTASTWTGGMIPRSIDNVIVQGSDVVTLIAAGSCSNLTLNAGTTLSLNAASLTIPGTSWNFDVTSTVIYNSTTTIQTAMAYGNLVYASTSSGGVSTTTPTNLTINGNLTVTAGTLRGISATSGTVTHTVAGNVIVGPGVAARISAVNSSNATTANCTWNIGGNVSLTGNNSGNRMIVFESAGPHTGTAVYNINGNLTIGGLSQLQVRSSTTANTSTCTGTVNVKGNLTTSGTIGSSTGATGTNFVLNFNGASAQRYAGAFPNAFPAGQTCTIQLNNDWGVTLDSMATLRANVALSFQSGLLSTTPTTLLTVNGGTIGSGKYHSYVEGPLARVIATGAQSPEFPVGDVTNYTPVSLQFGNVSTSGTLTVRSTYNLHPQIATSGLITDKTLMRYYSVSNTGTAFDNATATFNYGMIDVAPGSNPANYVVKKYDAGVWTTPTTANPLATSIQATGLTSFSDFAIGEPVPPVPTFTLTVNATNGTVAKNPDLASYDSASVVQLTATSALGYTFTGWSGSITSTDNPVNVTMDANKDITANFVLSAVIVPVPMVAGWNLVSVPVIQADSTAAAVFPGSFGDVFEYDAATNSYKPAPFVRVGVGYWVYYPGAQTVTISGPVMSSITVACAAGWNLIGSREVPVNTSALITNPAGQIFGDIFRYTPSGYVATTVIAPGEGVWLYVTGACTLTIP